MKHPNFQALDENAIRRELADDVARRIAAFEISEETTSTNDYLLHKTAAGGFHVCLAESQTAGKGRRGRKVWHSPKNGNLYLSVSRRGLAAKPRRSAWLGLTAAVEIVAALAADNAVGLGVKWPNDIYCDGGKLGGVLVESKGDCHVVGLGLNLRPPGEPPAAGVAWAALDEIRPGAFDRCGLASAMITAVVCAFDRIERDSIEALLDGWRRCDLLVDREVTVLAGAGALTGIARGVDEHGGLRVEHNGRGESGVRVYYSDDVSVRW